MLINFNDLKVKSISNELQPIARKDLMDFANIIYSNSRDIGVTEIARKIYLDEEVEINEDQKTKFLAVMQECRMPIIMVDAVKELLKDIK